MCNALETLAARLLPERQAHYERCCATLTRCKHSTNPSLIHSAQTTLGYALRALNATRAAAGLAPVAGPALLSLDELLGHAAACEAQRQGLGKLQAA